MTEVITAATAAEREREPHVPGIRTDLSNEAYHSIDSLSSTGIKRLLQSPAHYRWDMDNPREQTESMLLGTALHMAVLEPVLYADQLVVVPASAPKKPTAAQRAAAKPTPAAIESMAFWGRIEAEQAAGKLVLTEAQHDRVSGMVRAVQRHPMSEMLTDGAAEISFQWDDARLGIPCRCRFDYLRQDGIAIDLKTTVNASAEDFAKSAANFGYHLSAAHYGNGHEHLLDASLKAFVLLAVENTAPYCVAAYVLESDAILFGKDRVEEAMLLYKQCRDSGYWPGYTERTLPLRMPRWALRIDNPTRF